LICQLKVLPSASFIYVNNWSPS